MKLYYMGKFSGNEDDLPHGEHRPGAVPFREAKDAKALAVIANGLALAILILLVVPAVLRWGLTFLGPSSGLGCIASLAVLFPHELLHAVCFREDVYLYTNWSQGMLFVVGPEEMSKGRFILMSLLPNLVFGIFHIDLPHVIIPRITSGKTYTGRNLLNLEVHLNRVAGIGCGIRHVGEINK